MVLAWFPFNRNCPGLIIVTDVIEYINKDLTTVDFLIQQTTENIDPDYITSSRGTLLRQSLPNRNHTLLCSF